MAECGLPLVVRRGEAGVDGVEGIPLQWVDDLNFRTVVRDDFDLVQGFNLLGRYSVARPVPVGGTHVQCGFPPAFGVGGICFRDFDSVALEQLLSTTISIFYGYKEDEAAYFIDRNIWPVPGREENIAVGAVPTPLTDVIIARAVPRDVGKAVDTADLEEGE